MADLLTTQDIAAELHCSERKARAIIHALPHIGSHNAKIHRDVLEYFIRCGDVEQTKRYFARLTLEAMHEAKPANTFYAGAYQ